MESVLEQDRSLLDSRLAARLAALRGETSPTAALLGRLCTAYGRTMSRLLAEVEAEPVGLLRAAEQPVWTDPQTGFVRRSVSPPASGFDAEVVEALLPAGADIAYAAPGVAGLYQSLDADSSGIRSGWYRAPGWRVAARETKTHTSGHSL